MQCYRCSTSVGTVLRKITYSRGTYRLVLCEEHQHRYDRDMANFTRVAIEVDQPEELTPREECARCFMNTRATTAENIELDNQWLYLALCELHADKFHRLVFDWLRDAQEIKREQWVQSSVQVTANPAIWGEAPPSVPTPLALAKPPAPVPAAPPAQQVSPPQRQLTASQTATAAMAECNATWQDVVDAVQRPAIVTKSVEKPDITIYMTTTLSVLVAPDDTVIGVALREAQPAPIRRQTPAKIARKGKRAGSGTSGPRTIPDILAAIRAHAEWKVADQKSSGHYLALGPQGQRIQIPSTPSDWRTPLNVVSSLRRAGLDLRAG